MPAPRNNFANHFAKGRLNTSLLTERYCKRIGWQSWNVERFIPTANGGFSRDCFGFADLLCYKPINDALPKRKQKFRLALIQATTFEEHQIKHTKIRCNARAYELLRGGTVEIGLCSWTHGEPYNVDPYFYWFTLKDFLRLPNGLACEYRIKKRRFKQAGGQAIKPEFAGLF